MNTVAILGASGYAGGELIRLVDGHPDLHAVHLGGRSSAGKQLGDVHPHLGSGERLIAPNAVADVPDVDIAFLALPHGASWEPATALLGVADSMDADLIAVGSHSHMRWTPHYLGSVASFLSVEVGVETYRRWVSI